MAFETKVRAMVRELIKPIMDKMQNDSKSLLKLEKIDTKLEERINLLEMAVYKKEAGSGQTIFDEMDQKILKMDINTNKLIDNLQYQIDKHK